MFLQIQKQTSKKDQTKHEAFLLEQEAIPATSANEEHIHLPQQYSMRERNRSSASEKAPSTIPCVFCGKMRHLTDENFHAAAALVTKRVNSKDDKTYVVETTREWRQLAEDTNHSNLLSIIGTNKNPASDLRAAGVFYDLSCYVIARRKQERKTLQNSSLPSNKDFVLKYAAKQTAAFIQSHPLGKAIKLTDLWSVHNEILQRFDINENYHSTLFMNTLRKELPSLQLLHHGQGSATYVTLQSTIQNEMFEPEDAEEEYQVWLYIHITYHLLTRVKGSLYLSFR